MCGPSCPGIQRHHSQALLRLYPTVSFSSCCKANTAGRLLRLFIRTLWRSGFSLGTVDRGGCPARTIVKAAFAQRKVRSEKRRKKDKEQMKLGSGHLRSQGVCILYTSICSILGKESGGGSLTVSPKLFPDTSAGSCRPYRFSRPDRHISANT